MRGDPGDHLLAASPKRIKFSPQLAATFLIVGFVYPFEGDSLESGLRHPGLVEAPASARVHDFAGSVVVHAMGGWIALPAVLLLGARHGRYPRTGEISRTAVSSIRVPCPRRVDPDGRLVRLQRHEHQTLDKISGLVALNSLMAVVGGTLVALVMVERPRLRTQRAVAGLVAVCAGST